MYLSENRLIQAKKLRKVCIIFALKQNYADIFTQKRKNVAFCQFFYCYKLFSLYFASFNFEPLAVSFFKYLFQFLPLERKFPVPTGAQPEGPPMLSRVSQMAMSWRSAGGRLRHTCPFHVFTFSSEALAHTSPEMTSSKNR